MQSLVATLLIYILLIIFHLQHLINVASIGASAFIVFAMPNALTAKERNVVGGYISGVIFGSIAAFLIANCIVNGTR